MATLGLSPADKEAVEQFRRDVVEPSMTKLVIIDFWAEWCGPCKALGPTLEKVAADYASKGVVLAKVDVDANKFIAAQFQVRSIPTVYAMFQGQLVGDLTQDRTESQLKAKLDQWLKQLPIESDDAAQAAELEPLIAMGEQVLGEGDPARALGIFEQLDEMAPDHPAVVAGLARALVAAGRVEDAEAALAALSDDAARAPEIARARSAIELAKTATPVEDLSGLIARVAADPTDHESAMQLAGGQMAAGDRDAAAATLLASIATDKDWNDGAARHQLLTLFEAVGLEDPWVSAQRRKLSAILFG
ncbi:MAG: tetratricopeptide repeat protein [Pseudomonadota bacterium]